MDNDGEKDPMERLLAWSDEEWDALQDHMGTVHGWAVGHVLSADDIAGMQLEWRYHEDSEQRSCDAYALGLKHGRTEAGGTSLARALEKIDDLRAELSVEKTMAKIRERLSGQ